MSESSEKKNAIACVTGASGVIGRRIIKRLLADGWCVKALTRGCMVSDDCVQVIKGDMCDEDSLKDFIKDADALFHCAAELVDDSKMWDVNVAGTKKLLQAVEESRIQYICYLSSAGVVGNVRTRIVDETTECHPYNLYEKSKWEAEQIVARGVRGRNVIILRPANVVGEDNLGVLNLVRGGWRNRLKLFLKGGECAHVVHADDIAAAAIYFMGTASEKAQCYFVSCDHEAKNTYADIYAMYAAFRSRKRPNVGHIPLHMPVALAHAVRRLVRGRRNRGDVCFSSEKILASGFCFQNDLKTIARKMAASGL